MVVSELEDRYAIVGIDVGASKTRIGIGRADGKLYEKKVYKTCNVASDFIEFLIEEVRGFIRRSSKKVMGIGVASIGPLDLKRGVILSPPNAPLKNVEVVSALKEEFDVDVFLLNDAVAAAWAEKIYGIGRSYSNLVYITLSTGIGVGAVVDDNLLIGKDGNAHEAGHIVVDYSGTMKCRCGGLGHWEAYCSGINLPAFINKLIQEKYKEEVKKSVLYENFSKGMLTSEELYSYAKLGDELALKLVMEELGRINAAGVASVVNCYDPEVVILGGAIALNNKELVLTSLLKHIDMYLTVRKPLIEVSSLGEDVVLKGALAMVAKPPDALLKYMKRTTSS